MTETCDVVIVGAGPAGSAAATVLAQAQGRVLLLEKEEFPRPKVCGEFLSASALPSLERLGVRETIERLKPERIEEGSIHVPTRSPIPFRLPAPGLGISRFRLDELLARRAREAGADVRLGTRVLSIDPLADGQFHVRVAGPSGQAIHARAAIGAWGRWDTLDRRLDRSFLRRETRYFGWSRDYAGDARHLEGRVRLYLFPGGYCGLSRVEGGAAHLAGLISERIRRRLGSDWTEVLDFARTRNADLDTDLLPLRPKAAFLGTGPVFLTSKPPTEGGLLMAGDAAGVLDPFSGEGQATALTSGILAAETVVRLLTGELTPREAVQAYEEAWRRRFAKRFAWSAAFRCLVLHPRLGAVAGRLLGSGLVRFGLNAVRQ